MGGDHLHKLFHRHRADLFSQNPFLQKRKTIRAADAHGFQQDSTLGGRLGLFVEFQ